ncbi:hypothetical protein DYI23_08410 [Roseibium polysiphoniae]|uniref:Uncharacterized protein n=1 Tax=Roseibium polysiphoniae TaxID=2571221 RepID=A0A944CDK7_9HYPH|nr:hypothetical protein [Roseibium polysiphoniae]
MKEPTDTYGDIYFYLRLKPSVFTIRLTQLTTIAQLIGTFSLQFTDLTFHGKVAERPQYCWEYLALETLGAWK